MASQKVRPTALQLVKNVVAPTYAPPLKDQPGPKPAYKRGSVKTEPLVEPNAGKFLSRKLFSDSNYSQKTYPEENNRAGFRYDSCGPQQGNRCIDLEI
jgi:hypothetical protein